MFPPSCAGCIRKVYPRFCKCVVSLRSPTVFSITNGFTRAMLKPEVQCSSRRSWTAEGEQHSKDGLVCDVRAGNSLASDELKPFYQLINCRRKERRRKKEKNANEERIKWQNTRQSSSMSHGHHTHTNTRTCTHTNARTHAGGIPTPWGGLSCRPHAPSNHFHLPFTAASHLRFS